MSVAQKVAYIRAQTPWSVRLGSDVGVEVDVEFLVDQLRVLSRSLSEDAAAQAGELGKWLTFNPIRKEKLRDELRLLALDISPGVRTDELPTEALDWRNAGGVAERAWRQYLLRVAYLALTRVLLYRSWEDVEFVKSYLYDGGFDHAYEELAQNVSDVLREAFLHGAERYRWLFGGDNNYDWYQPREPALVEVLYLLAPVPLGKLDADVLGELYVSYVDEIDRDRLGQFFTPRPVVRFMLDRVEFAGERVFRIEGDERKLLSVLDFATGSGGFLVEAARRIIDEGGVPEDDAPGLLEALAAIATGFVGGEISPFPYYLTEVNLLLQVSRLLGRLRLLNETAPPFVLGVLHIDTLSAKSQADESLDVDAKLRGDRAELTQRGFDLAQLDGEKRERFRQLRKDAQFDLVVGNPPYVAEANNKPLFDRLRAIEAWKGIYKGKTDYSYYFLYLAVEKLAPGGRLCVITPAGWMNAGQADFLREKLTTELRLEQLFLFGAYRLFAADQGPAPTPTVESAILVASKKSPTAKQKVRVVVLEDETKWPDRTELLHEMARRARGKPGRRKGIFCHDVLQSELRPEYPWPVKFGERETPTLVVGHLQSMLDDDGASVEPLKNAWKVFTGIETAADAYSKRIKKHLPATVQKELDEAGAVLGEPIMELPPGDEHSEPWKSNQQVLARSPESRAVLYGTLDEPDYVHYVRLDRADEPAREVLEALERWKPLLRRRAEIARNPKRRWWETAWPRNAEALASPKVIALFRTDRGRFALDERGEWQPGKKLTVIVGKEESAPVAYLCGLLNSELLDLWYAVRGKTPWHVRRNYEPKRMNEIPYRVPEGDARADRIAELVREIARNRQALLPHRPFVRELTRIIKDPWKEGPIVTDDAALVASLPAAATVSVRLDPELEVVAAPRGRATPTSPTVLTFRRGAKETGRVQGEQIRLEMVQALVANRSTDDVESMTLPKDLEAFERLKAKRALEVAQLLAEGRRLVEEVERLVCDLYDVSDDLTDAVIDHAVNRAAVSQASEE